MRHQHPDPMTVPFTYITTTDEAIAAFAEMAEAEVLAIDTETEVIPGSDLDRDGPGAWVVLSAAGRYSTPDGEAVEKVWVLNMSDIDYPAIREAVKPLVALAWNATFERRVFKNAGIEARKWRDLMLGEADLRQGAAADGKPWYMSLGDAARLFFGLDLEGKGDLRLSFKRNVELTEEQKAYAAQDAVVTLWLEPVLTEEFANAFLDEAVLLDMNGQPLIQDFNLNGIWADAAGWLKFIAKQNELIAEAESRLADLTGGGQGNLFSETVKPNWKPGSPDDVRRVLNQYCPDEVTAYATQWLGGSRLLAKADSVDADALELIGGPIADALLHWSEHAKIVTTWGAEFMDKRHADGRFHARYLQALVATGRLSSDNPNFQNLTPHMKAYLRPTACSKPVTQMSLEELVAEEVEELRVFVAVDASQAELRKLAQESGDPILVNAFLNRDDLHVTTAAGMFELDKDELLAAVKAGDPDAVDKRGKGKTLNFATVYGFSGDALAKTLTINALKEARLDGRDRSAVAVIEPKAGADLLARYFRAYPGVDAYLKKRDAECLAVSEACMDASRTSFDWDATWKLLQFWPRVKSAKFRLRDRIGHMPSPDEIAAELIPSISVERELERSLGRPPTADETHEALEAKRDVVRWVCSFRAPAVLAADGKPFSFESRTSCGRRRLFQVSADDWMTSMLLKAARSNKPQAQQVRDAWSLENNMSLVVTDRSGRTKPLSMSALKKRFDGTGGKDLKASFVAYVLNAMPHGSDFLQRAGVADAVRGAIRQYRNHPIQGGVADAVLYAFGLLDERLPEVSSALAVQSVHDSIVIECSVHDARRVAEILTVTMEEALTRICPDVTVKADCDIMASLNAKYDLIDDETLDRLCALDLELRNAYAEAA